MRELEQGRAEARAWEYFRVILPVSRERLKERYKQASDRMRPGKHPGNTKGEFMEMRDFYHELLESNPSWAFTTERPVRHEKRPNRGKGGRFSHPNKFRYSGMTAVIPKD